MIQAMTEYLALVNKLRNEVTNYLGSECTNNASAKRIRSASVELGKASAGMRKATVAHHKKTKES